MAAIEVRGDKRLGWREQLGAAPIPHEHGAWVILYAPLVIGFAAARFAWLPALLLTLSVTGAYLARHAAALQFRKRARDGSGFWLGVYIALFAAGTLPLFAVYRRWDLLAIGGVIAALFAINILMTLWPSRKRLDRSILGELLAVAALTMTAPAAYVVSRGALDSRAWILWAANFLFFGGGIVHVKMFFSAIKVKGIFTTEDRLRAGRENLLYHAAALLLVGWAAVEIGGMAGVLACLAFVPALVRAFKGIITLTNKLPPLKRVGIFESVYAVWFAALLSAALRLA